MHAVPPSFGTTPAAAQLACAQDAFAAGHRRRAARAFAGAVRHAPELARQVGAFYSAHADRLYARHARRAAWRNYRRAEGYYRQCVTAAPSAADRADALWQVAQQNHKVSLASRRGFDASANRAARLYYGDALQSFAQLLPVNPALYSVRLHAAYAERFASAVHALGENMGRPRRPWRQQGARHLLPAACADLVTLLRASKEAPEDKTLREYVGCAAVLLEQPLDAASARICQTALLPCLLALLDARASAALQQTAFSALATAARRQPGLCAPLAAALHEKVVAQGVRLAAVEALIDCYEALIEGDAALTAEVAAQLPSLHSAFFSDERSLQLVAKLALEVVRLQGVACAPAVQLALATLRALGTQHRDLALLEFIVACLGYAARTFAALMQPAMAALVAVGLAAEGVPMAGREVLRGNIVRLLWGMQNEAYPPAVRAAARRAVLDQLHVLPEEAQEVAGDDDGPTLLPTALQHPDPHAPDATTLAAWPEACQQGFLRRAQPRGKHASLSPTSTF